LARGAISRAASRPDDLFIARSCPGIDQNPLAPGTKLAPEPRRTTPSRWDTPAEIIDKLNREINAALADPKLKARLAELGGTVLPESPADFGNLIADETEKWGKVIRAANIRAQ
jgi:hypothetical protein